MLHLRELQVLHCAHVVERERERERETGRLWENRLITKTAFPSLDVTCARAVWSRCARERREGKN